MNTQSRVLKIFHWELGCEHMGLDSLFTDEGIDSLEMVEIVTEIEEEFDVSISDEVMDSWRKPRDVVEYLERVNGLER